MTYPLTPSILPSSPNPLSPFTSPPPIPIQYRASAPITAIDWWSLHDIVQYYHTPTTTSQPPLILQWNAYIAFSSTSLTRRSLYHYSSFMGRGIELMVGISNDLLATLSSSTMAADLWVSQNVYRYMI
ncbi:unnamed protein product [Lactuca saligna]|uniref:Uncharacterized protein n=1 Tax=Lactuca saligna TaxID=75948 RepID=A0AA36ENN2_LACSI|nr:unnamed protein product [Lactuca saligna]